MLASDLDLAGEAEIIADQDLASCHHSRREGHVRRVAHDNHIAIGTESVVGLDLEQPEIAGSVMSQPVGLFID